MNQPPPPPDAPVIDIPRGFQTLTPPDEILSDIPAPVYNVPISAVDFSGVGVEGGRSDGNPEIKEGVQEDLLNIPTVVPYTVRPELLNTREVLRALENNYPPTLKNAGIGGEVVLWILVSEEGQVLNTSLHRSSGYDAFDQAAVTVARTMRFSPALNRNEKVMVWIEMPITFKTN